jgi:hypothetical protein
MRNDLQSIKHFVKMQMMKKLKIGVLIMDTNLK